jgi:hypothetical protein
MAGQNDVQVLDVGAACSEALKGSAACFRRHAPLGLLRLRTSRYLSRSPASTFHSGAPPDSHSTAWASMTWRILTILNMTASPSAKRGPLAM